MPTTMRSDGSAQSPFFVQSVDSMSAEKRAEDAEDRKGKRDSDAALVRWTEGLAFATFGLGAATLLLGYFGFRQSRDMKESIAAANRANELNRENFDSVHRPKIRLKHCILESDIWQGERMRISLTCVNYGTSVALLHEVGIRCFVVKATHELPMQPAIPAAFAQNVNLLSGRNYTFPNIDTELILSDRDNVSIQQGDAKLFCIGYISYFDQARRMRITGFCRELTFPENALAHRQNCRFRKFDDPDYEYED